MADIPQNVEVFWLRLIAKMAANDHHHVVRRRAQFVPILARVDCDPMAKTFQRTSERIGKMESAPLLIWRVSRTGEPAHLDGNSQQRSRTLRRSPGRLRLPSARASMT